MTKPDFNKIFPMTAKTMAGLEEVLADELKQIGAKDIHTGKRVVVFKGDKEVMYRANLWLRTALRILVPIAEFKAGSEKELYEKIKSIEWENHFGLQNTFAINSTVHSPVFTHSHYAALKAKDAIADRFSEKLNKRPDVDPRRPDVLIDLRINKQNCTLSLDSSGESLHKRGYREKGGQAPINEVLAAGLVLLTAWKGDTPLVNPMCGSGTIAIEAGMIAKNQAPRLQRPLFGFQKWKDYDEQLWRRIFQEAQNAVKPVEKHLIFASDQAAKAFHICRENVDNAKLDDTIRIQKSAFQLFKPPRDGNVLIINPPYGERMDEQETETLYRSIGDIFKQQYAGYDCWLISSNLQALKKIGLRSSKRLIVYNGPLECRYAKYEMFEGKLEDG